MALGWNLYLSTVILLVVTAVYTIAGRAEGRSCWGVAPGAETEGQGEVEWETSDYRHTEEKTRGERCPEGGVKRKLTLRENEKQDGTKSGRESCRIRGKERHSVAETRGDGKGRNKRKQSQPERGREGETLTDTEKDLLQQGAG